MLEKLKQLIDETVQGNEPMANQVTFKIGGPAKYFFIARNSDQLLKACQAADQLGIRFAVIGLGSNVIVADQGFDGLVVKLTDGIIELKDERAMSEAGADLQKLVALTTRAGLSGLEKLAGIPSSVGGAVRGNAGAFGQEIKDVVDTVEIYRDGRVETLSNSDCHFTYRHSIFKDQPGVLLRVNLQLKRSTPKEMTAAAALTLENRKHLPTEPSAGCIFKNIELSRVEVDKARVMRALDITEEQYAQATKFGKLPVGFILDKLGYAGEKIGGIQVSPKHCAYMINTGDGKAEHVVIFASKIKMRVRNELGIQLQEEVQLLGF